MHHLFLIGPGGVGKTSAGRLLAPMLSRRFVDLDEEFCAHVGPLRPFLDAFGYAAYVRRNGLLFHELLEGTPEPVVLALSSGFLETDVEPETIASNRALVKSAGTSILLMPSRSQEESSRIVVERQMERGLNLERVSQARIFAERFAAYMTMGDIQLFSVGSPLEIAMQIKQELAKKTPGSHNGIWGHSCS
ncbi:shikimate kinase [Granulicella pectinivorans]|uniref:Shikimate kinase n=1 Tax=Granulicella pectinivorans TaxID=474950 RepID=A0A1I6LLG4_9BACT|nr:shikimate kinase [Granulicella pectinivorans]SFS04325.1 shikimate kinase [Granulicella pectinivorans]